jgi:hypothetical protein
MVRRRVWVIIAIQLVIPAVLLLVRWSDPSVGQLRGGWQMHTSCWGRDEPCR